MSKSEMAALIKLVWLSEIGILLLGKENRKALHKQRKMARAEQKNSPLWCDLENLERYQLSCVLRKHIMYLHVQRYQRFEEDLWAVALNKKLYREKL